MSKTTFLFLLSFYCYPLYATQLLEVFPKIYNDTIKFVLTEHNNISIPALLNQEDSVQLMFHTDIGSVSLTPEMCKKLNSNQDSKSSIASSWTGSEDVEYIENNSLAIGAQKWDSLTVWLDMLSGPDTDGKFGPNLFEDYIIEINNDENILVLHEQQGFSIDASVYHTFQLTTNENNSLFVEGNIGIGTSSLPHKFLIHSGYGGTIILDDQFKKGHSSLNNLAIVSENDLKDSFGNIIKTKKVLVDKFEVLGASFRNMPLSYFDSEIEIQKTSVLGGELLKRFNIFLDIKNMEIHVTENRNTSLAFRTK